MLSASTFMQPPARVVGYTWGAEDLAAAVGASANRNADGGFEDTFRLARAQCLLAAAAAGIGAYDTTDTEFKDTAAVERRAQAARRDGFVGKLADPSRTTRAHSCRVRAQRH